MLHCCIALLFALLLLTPLAPAVQRPHMLLPTLFSPLPLLSKVRLPPLLFALLLQLLITPRAPAVQWPHGLLPTLFPPLSLL